MADAVDMAPRLRQADLAEIKAHSNNEPAQSLQHGVYWSEPAYTVEFLGKPAAIFGVVPVKQGDFGWDWPTGHPHPSGSVWLLGTDDIPLFSRRFLRHSREWLAELEMRYRVLGNMVDVRNTAHVRWIEWLGFTMLDTIDYGPFNLPFQRFYKESKRV